MELDELRDPQRLAAQACRSGWCRPDRRVHRPRHRQGVRTRAHTGQARRRLAVAAPAPQAEGADPPPVQCPPSDRRRPRPGAGPGRTGRGCHRRAARQRGAGAIVAAPAGDVSFPADPDPLDREPRGTPVARRPATAPPQARPPCAPPRRGPSERGSAGLRASSPWCCRCSRARLVQLQGIDPRQYAAMAAAEGSVSVVLPAERGDILDRNGQPLADSVDGLMVVADPSLTVRVGARAGAVPVQAPRRRLLRDPRTAARHRQPLPVRRPPGACLARHHGGRARPARRASRGSTRARTRCAATRPATSPPTWSASSARPKQGRVGPAVGRSGGRLRPVPRRPRRRGALPGRRQRQPDPAGQQHRRRSPRRPATSRPPSTATCSGTPSRCWPTRSTTPGATPGTPW